MNKIVKPNRRYNSWSRGQNPAAWTVIVEYQGRDIAPQNIIPMWLRERWAATKSGLGYANFEGFTIEEAFACIALAKTGVLSLGVDRWGRVSCYKIQLARTYSLAPAPISGNRDNTAQCSQQSPGRVGPPEIGRGTKPR